MIINLKLFVEFELVNVADFDLNQVADLLVRRPIIVFQESLKILVRSLSAIMRVETGVAAE
jgi:hypothetical protein